ncbi:MAG: hypothetical protein KatS3mg111_3087 [Pirellulaceae bacterium]|nr:MAG: hypothetical protein KatS3mg111_3087 [Pirellulaceae bacterium]
MSNIAENQVRILEERFQLKTALVGVVGLGYVGLPLIDAFTRAGFATLGFDVDQQKVDRAEGGAELHRAHSLLEDPDMAG